MEAILRGSVHGWDSVCDQTRGFSLVLTFQEELKTRVAGRTKQSGMVGRLVCLNFLLYNNN